MLKRYELTGQEWERIASLLPSETTGKPGQPPKDNRLMLDAMVWIARSGALCRHLPKRYGLWESVYSRIRKWTQQEIHETIFQTFSLDTDWDEIFMDASIA